MKKQLQLSTLLVAAAVISLPWGCAAQKYAYPETHISIANLRRTVEFLTTLTPPRNHRHPASMRRSADYIARSLTGYGLAPERQAFRVAGQVYENVIASTGPSGGPRVIVGAHYDVFGEFPGADDNASGVAGLLEIARFTAQHASALPYGVDFVAFALEEPPYFSTPHMGSYRHAKLLHDNGVEVRGMICLEMIGFFTEKRNTQRYPLSLMRLFYPGTGDFIGVVSNFSGGSLVRQLSRHLAATPMKVETLRAPSFLTGVDFSDHRNYWHFGYEAVMITDTAFYRNTNYHEPTDTMETLDFEKMQQVVKGIGWALLHMK